MSMYSIVPHDHALNLLQMPEHVDERCDHREERDHRKTRIGNSGSVARSRRKFTKFTKQ